MWIQKGVFLFCLLNVLRTASSEVSSTKVHDAVNSFSANLLKELSGEQPRNLITSPLGVAILLALLHQGARNNSASQLESVLQLAQQESKEVYGQLYRQLQEQRNTSVVLELANRLFLKEHFSLTQNFRDVSVHDFQSGIQQVTFGSGVGETAINNWVSEKTHGRIPSIVEPTLSSDTVMVMVNAIFFKGAWEERFNKYITSNQTFSPRRGLEVSVPFMHHYSERFRAGIDVDRDVKWVQLPFEGGDYSMVIIVPTQKYGLSALMRNFTGETLGQLLAAGTYRDVTLALPRFKLSSKLDLEAPLKELGAADIFDQYASDLSGISMSSGRLYVSKAVQKADIEVDEEGATAAAATALGFRPTSLRIPVNLMRITADHPFLAVITENAKRLPLFMATVVDPSRVDGN